MKCVKAKTPLGGVMHSNVHSKGPQVQIEKRKWHQISKLGDKTHELACHFTFHHHANS